MDGSSPYLTTAEAAKYLRFNSTSAIRSLVSRGELSPSGAGPKGTLLFRVEELDRFVQARIRRRGYRPEMESEHGVDVPVYRPVKIAPSRRERAQAAIHLSRL